MRVHHEYSSSFSLTVTPFQSIEFKIITTASLHLLFGILVPTKGGDWSSQGSPWGPVELVAVIAGPVFLLCVLLMVGVFLFQYHQRAYSHRQRLEVEDPSCDHLYLAKDKTLQDLIYDMSTSGSGSGQYMLPDVIKKKRMYFWNSFFANALERTHRHQTSCPYVTL